MRFKHLRIGRVVKIDTDSFSGQFSVGDLLNLPDPDNNGWQGEWTPDHYAFSKHRASTYFITAYNDSQGVKLAPANVVSQLSVTSRATLNQMRWPWQILQPVVPKFAKTSVGKKDFPEGASYDSEQAAQLSEIYCKLLP